MMRAKFIVSSVERFQGGEKVSFMAVGKSTAYPADGSDEDNTFSKFTPQATLTIVITNPGLHSKFNPGDKFYADFTPA